ncbi:MAG: FAD binding domain-containing protein [Solirubrobacterales bacterium]
MKPAPFRYEDPATLEMALELLAEHGDEAAILAGGQSLVPLLNTRALRPGVVIDVNRIPGLHLIEIGPDHVRIGALARAGALERDRGLGSALPILRDALRYVAVPQVRARTTIGGSVAYADPAAELPAVVAALDGEIELASKGGGRTVAWREFFRLPYAPARRPDELIVAVRLARRAGLGFAFTEVGRRRIAPALAGACTGLARTNGAVEAARIIVAAMRSGPLRLDVAERALVGRALDEGALAALGREVVAELAPHAEGLDEADYRIRVTATMVCRDAQALWEEAGRAS